MADRDYTRRLKNLILDGHLQLRYVILVTGVSMAIAVALGLLIFQQSTFASDQIMASLDGPGMDWLDEQTKAAVRVQLGQTDYDLVVTMVAVGLGLTLVVVVSLVAMTHRMAGPLCRMSEYFSSLEQGRLPPPGYLRRGDLLHEVFDTLRATHEALREQARTDIATMSGFIDSVDETEPLSPPLQAALHDLRRILEEKRDSL
ncbi:hypothetical protein ACFL6C_10240 [Myxococcota bacterium]